jgi:hypothetical protein
VSAPLLRSPLTNTFYYLGTPSLTRTSRVSLFDTCYDLSDRTNVEVPAVSVQFEGGGSLRLPAKNYLIPTGIHGASGDFDRGREEQYQSNDAGCPPPLNYNPDRRFRL